MRKETKDRTHEKGYKRKGTRERRQETGGTWFSKASVLVDTWRGEVC